LLCLIGGLNPLDATVSEDELLERIRQKELVGYLVLPADLLSGGQVVYRGANAANFGAMATLGRGIQNAVVAARAAALHLTPAQAQALTANVPLATIHTTGDKNGSSGTAAFILGYAIMFVIYLSIAIYAVNVMRSVVQEKTSRVVEIIVASIKPSELMTGKILGVGSVGLLQLFLWLAMAATLLKYRAALLASSGVTEVGNLALPPVGAATLAIIFVYFVLGYFLFASLYAAVGAMCSSDQDAQQAQTPVMLLLILPAACVSIVGSDPRGHAAAVLTQIPFASPVLMPMRWLLGGASVAEVAQSITLLLLAIALVVWAAARIYRVGIMSYGKRPSLAELWRWIRHA
jgi:ABC-2 type transport system permease protein